VSFFEPSSTIKMHLFLNGGSISHYKEILENQKLQRQNHVYQNINFFVPAMMISGIGYGIYICMDFG
jgi:hypothetical protein